MADQGGPAGLRRSYERDVLLEAQAEPDPMVQFGRWFEEAPRRRDLRAQRRWRWPRSGRTGSRRCGWCCSRASMRAASSSTPTWRAARRVELAGNPPGGAAVLVGPPAPPGADRGRRSSCVDAAEADAYFASRPLWQPHRRLASPQSRVIDGAAAAGGAGGGQLRSRYPGGDPSRGRRTGAATGSGRRRSSSGRDGAAGCTTGCATRGTATAGGSSGWRHDVLSALMLRSPGWCRLRQAVGSGS